MQNLWTVLVALLIIGASYARAGHRTTEEKTATFVFRQGNNDLFLLKDNEAELERLYGWVEEYRAEITAGHLPIRVDSYCASLPTVKENLTTAFTRANRVKSELITDKGLKKTDFVTANYARAYDNKQDVVVVTLRIQPKATPEPRKETVQEKPQREAPPVETDSRPAPAVEKAPELTAEAAPEAAAPAKPYWLAVRTNVLYDVLLLPTLGVEWRINRHVGVKLDGSLAWWGNEHGKVHKMWLLNPEVRWYLLKNKRFYTGISGNLGQYNVYKYAIGSIASKDTGHQGTMWSMGLTVGYQLPLSHHLSIDFNLGLGYTRFDYDTFGMTDGLRVNKERDRAKNFWGPTQAGVNLVWTIAGNK